MENKIEYYKKEISKLEKTIETIKKMNEKTCRCEMHISGTDVGVDFYFIPLKANVSRPIISHLRKLINSYSSKLYWEKKKIEEQPNGNERAED